MKEKCKEIYDRIKNYIKQIKSISDDEQLSFVEKREKTQKAVDTISSIKNILLSYILLNKELSYVDMIAGENKSFRRAYSKRLKKIDDNGSLLEIMEQINKLREKYSPAINSFEKKNMNKISDETGQGILVEEFDDLFIDGGLYFDEASFYKMSLILGSKHFQSRKLTIDHVDKFSMKDITGVLERDILSEIHFSRLNLNKEELDLFATSVMTNSSLRSLELDICSISAKDLEPLSKLLKSPQNSLLSLSFNNTPLIEDPVNRISKEEIDGLKEFGESLVTGNLVKLSLLGCKLGDNGLKILAPYLEKCGIEALNLTGNNITDKQGQAIADIIKNSNIRKLFFRANRITESTVKHILDVIEGESNSLSFFTFTCPRLSEDVVKRIENLPNKITIKWSRG